MGPFGYGNLGDAAIVEAMLQNLRMRHPDWAVIGFTLDPDDTERRHGITSFPLSRMSSRAAHGEEGPYGRTMRRLRTSRNTLARRVERVVSRVPAEFGMLARSYRALEDVDVLVACGSGQLQDYWGGGGPFSYPYTMLRWAILAKLRRAKFMVVSVGAGPIDARLSRRFFRWALSLTSYRSYRDEWSKSLIAELVGFRRDDKVYPDLAFSLSLSRDVERLRQIDRRKSSAWVVGVGPIGYFRDGTWPVADDARYATYLDTMVAFVSSVLAGGHAVIFLKGEAHYDQLVIDEILGELRARDIDLTNLVLDTPMTTVNDVLVALSRCDAVVASRFHNVLLSYLVGRPVVALSYQSKIDSLMAEFDQARFCLTIVDAEVETMLTRLHELMVQPDFTDRAFAVSEQKRRELEDQYDHIFSEL